jgi:hypothetical protein
LNVAGRAAEPDGTPGSSGPKRLAGAELLVAFRAVTALVVGLAQCELAGPLALKAGKSAEETIHRFRALPEDRFPHLRQAADAARRSTPEQEFEAALRLLTTGLSSGGKARA